MRNVQRFVISSFFCFARVLSRTFCLRVNRLCYSRTAFLVCVKQHCFNIFNTRSHYSKSELWEHRFYWPYARSQNHKNDWRKRTRKATNQSFYTSTWFYNSSIDLQRSSKLSNLSIFRAHLALRMMPISRWIWYVVCLLLFLSLPSISSTICQKLKLREWLTQTYAQSNKRDIGRPAIVYTCRTQYFWRFQSCFEFTPSNSDGARLHESCELMWDAWLKKV